MRSLADQEYQNTSHIDPVKLVNDPRWREIREAAARFRALLRR
jgi:hypothetical protein